MSEINSTVNEIIDMLYNLLERPYDFILEDYEKLSVLTSSIWNDFHCELISELNKMDFECVDEKGKAFDIDYQRLWYESLGFPQREAPSIYTKCGEPLFICSGDLPSNLNTAIAYHDAQILRYSLDNNDLTLYLDACSNDVSKVKITFIDVVAVLNKDKESDYTYCRCEIRDALGKDSGDYIVSAYEIPAIDYIFKNFNMPKEFCLYDSRYFYLDMMWREYRDLLIIFDRCNIEEYT